MSALAKKTISKEKIKKTESNSKKVKSTKSNRITTKGQVTIPQYIREEGGFLPNTAINFVCENNRVYLEKASDSKKLTRGQQIVQRLRGACKTGMTTEEIMKLTRGE